MVHAEVYICGQQSAILYACLLDTTVSPAKTDELIEMPFAM